MKPQPGPGTLAATLVHSRRAGAHSAFLTANRGRAAPGDGGSTARLTRDVREWEDAAGEACTFGEVPPRPGRWPGQRPAQVPAPPPQAWPAQGAKSAPFRTPLRETGRELAVAATLTRLLPKCALVQLPAEAGDSSPSSTVLLLRTGNLCSFGSQKQKLVNTEHRFPSNLCSISEARPIAAMFQTLVMTQLSFDTMSERAQKAFAISFCTSSLRTEMEAKHCLEKILGPNANGPVKYAGQADW